MPPEGHCEEVVVVQKSPYFSTTSSMVRDILFFFSGAVKSTSCTVGLLGQRHHAKHFGINSYECDRSLVRIRAIKTFKKWAARNLRVRIGSHAVLKTSTTFRENPKISPKSCNIVPKMAEICKISQIYYM